ncbi:MAG: protein kinase [Gemmatimonadota bacterium]|nr:protein kinase [Gemmatimonadota bacterium]
MHRSGGDGSGSANESPELESIVRRALELRGEARASFLAEACGDDLLLRARVDARLSAAEREATLGPDVDDDTPSVGYHIHQYRIERRLGGGAMGVVYSAWDTRLDRRVALKFMPRHMSLDPVSKKRFLVEARAAAGIDHPNICQVYEIGEAPNGRLFIAMGFYGGETLKKKLADGPLPLAESLDYFIQIAAGLSAAHARGIIHRDIKPANVLVTEEGVAKVLDFGVAKRESDEMTLTEVGESVGTLGYMSPEQIHADEVDHRTDIWSLAVLLYEMLTGRRPFSADRIPAVMHAIVAGDPEKPSDLNANIPSDIEACLMRGLEKEPDDRPDTVADFAHEMLAISGGTPPTGLHTGVHPSIGGRSRGLQRLGWAAVASILLLVAVIVFRWMSPAFGPAPDPAIAVLPFLTLSSDPEDEFFTDGIHSEVINRLSQFGSLRVTPPASVQRYRGYRDSARTPQEIAEELDVTHLLEGTLQRFADRVRITALLTDTRSDNTSWSNAYEKERDDLFAIQREVGEDIATNLNLRLSPEERERIDAGARPDPEAYELYITGRGYEERSRNAPDITQALRMYQRALQADPDFALAHARAGFMHLRMYWFAHDPRPERLAMARAAIDRAFDLNPDLPEAHLIQAWYLYQGERDYDAALAQLERAEGAGAPEADVLRLRGAIQRRSGDFASAATHLAAALELDPRNAGLALDVGNTLAALGRHDEAETYFDRAIAIGPPDGSHYWWKAWNRVLRDGDADRAREVLVEAERIQPASWRERTRHWTRIEFLAGDPAAALEWALAEPSPWIPTQYGDIPTDILIGEAYFRLDEMEAARRHYGAARDSLERRLETDPEDAFARRNLSFAHARLGNETEAVSQGLQARDLMPMSEDALVAPDFVRDLAAVYMAVGEPEMALDHLEYLLGRPQRSISVPLLRSSPLWDPLREHARFQELVRER